MPFLEEPDNLLCLISIKIPHLFDFVECLPSNRIIIRLKLMYFNRPVHSCYKYNSHYFETCSLWFIVQFDLIITRLDYLSFDYVDTVRQIPCIIDRIIRQALVNVSLVCTYFSLNFHLIRP